MSTRNQPLTLRCWPSKLPSEQPHVWVADMRNLPRDFDWGAVLSVDEKERAAQFRFAMHRKRFMVWRSVLKMLLGWYLDLDPARVVLAYGLNRKPRVAGSQVEFNVSHTEDLCLFGFAQCPIGIDVERVRQVPECLEIAHRFFSADEAERLRAERSIGRAKAFFRFWTRKEAVLKALGVGLSFGLDRFSVSLDEPTYVLRWADDAMRPSEWTLFHLDPAPGYVAAVAVTTSCDQPLIFSPADLCATIWGA